jgi:nitrogen regulatory protein P-II 2
MKMVTAIIKPFKFDEVREALLSIGVQGMTFTEVKGFGRQMVHGEFYTGPGFAEDFLPKVLLEVAVDEDLLSLVIEYIKSAAYTGSIGDGKILVRDIEQVFRIRTGEAGTDAI